MEHAGRPPRILLDLAGFGAKVRLIRGQCSDTIEETIHVRDARFIPLSRRSFLAGTAAAGALVMLHPFSARAQANQAHLRIMETTDLHVHVLPYDYYADKPNDTMGLSRTASIIDAIRAEATNSMLIDNGDFLQGNPMGDYIAYEHGMKDGDVHPVIKAMNVLGYDCSTLGNHEFNYGLDFMFKVLAGANFPFVCANLTKGQLAADPTQGRAVPQALCDPRQDDQGRRRRRASDPDRPHRLRAAADHDLGLAPPRRQGDDPRHRQGGQGLGAADEGGGRRYRHRAVAFRHRARRNMPRRWRTPRSCSPASTASTRSSPATASRFPRHQVRRRRRRRHRQGH